MSGPGDGPIITVTVKCDLDYDEIFGRVHVQASGDRTLDWVLDEFCREKKVKRKSTFALRTEAMADIKLDSTLATAGLNDGALIYAYNKDPPKPPPDVRERGATGCTIWNILGLVAIIIAIVGLILMLCLWFIPLRYTSNVEYGILIDAGSTSSKIYLYQWHIPTKTNDNVGVTQVDTCKVEPGISSYSMNVSDVANGILTCLKDQLIPNLSRQDVPRTSLNLGATAGMRMLQHSDAKASAAIYRTLRSDLKKSGLRIKSDDQIRTISGMEEAINAWITVNYVSGQFGLMDDNGIPKTPPVEPMETYGSLDLGGASTQISFVTDPSTEYHAKYQTKLDLFKQTYNVFGHSFLCYGKSAVRNRLNAILAQEGDFSLQVEDPCRPRGSTEKILAKDVFTVPCVSGKFALDSYGHEIIPPGRINLEKDVFNFTGGSDRTKCQLEVKKLFNKTISCGYDSCSFNGIFQPQVRGKFYAFAGFYYVMNYLNLTATNVRPQADYNTFQSSLQDLCSKNVSQLYLGSTPSEIVEGYCFDGYYIKTLLNLYKFNASNWDTIRFVDKVNNYTVGWSLGFMIEQTGDQDMSPYDTSGQRIKMPAFIIPVILCILLFILGIVLCVVGIKQRKSRRPNYAADAGVQEYGSLK